MLVRAEWGALSGASVRHGLSFRSWLTSRWGTGPLYSGMSLDAPEGVKIGADSGVEPGACVTPLVAPLQGRVEATGLLPLRRAGPTPLIRRNCWNVRVAPAGLYDAGLEPARSDCRSDALPVGRIACVQVPRGRSGAGASSRTRSLCEPHGAPLRERVRGTGVFFSLEGKRGTDPQYTGKSLSRPSVQDCLCVLVP